MRTNKIGLPGRLLSVVAVAWTGLALLWALQIVLPTPSFTLWFVTVLAKESGLLLAGFASVGVALALVSRLHGARRSVLASAVMGAAAVFLSLMPTAQAWNTARAEDAPLSPSEQFSRPTAEGPSETVTYASPGGDDLSLDVWRPDGGEVAGGRPAVVLVHGGGWRSGARGDTPLWDAWLAERGYVVFDADYRLAPPPRWQDAPGDVKCAVGWVRENAARYGVDPDRVALVGYSAGGHLALLSAYTAGDGRLPPSCGAGYAGVAAGVAAVAAFYPPTDLKRLHDMEWPWARPNVVGLESTKDFLGGAPATVPGRYRAASPADNVDPDDPPTFLVHGGADRVVPAAQSGLLARRLERAGVPHRYLLLPWADHSFDHASDLSWGGNGAQITRSALGPFLDRHLAPENDGEPPPGG